MKAVLGDLGGELPGVLQVMEAGRVSARLWRGDTTLWTQDPSEADEAARRLGWLLLPESMAGHAAEFEALRSQLMAEGYRHAVVLGMGGSSLAPDVFRRMLPAARGLELHVLDSTDPEMVASLARTIPVETTLFLVSSKSGTTTEPLALFDLAAGSGALFITPEGSRVVSATTRTWTAAGPVMDCHGQSTLTRQSCFIGQLMDP